MRFYVYAVVDDAGLPLYVGKGSKYRSGISAKRYKGRATILERFQTETEAYRAERRYIKRLKPQFNKCGGGNGSRSTRKRYVRSKEEMLMARIGTRAYAARIIVSKIDERNAAQYGISKTDLDRLRQVANGSWPENGRQEARLTQ